MRIKIGVVVGVTIKDNASVSYSPLFVGLPGEARNLFREVIESEGKHKKKQFDGVVLLNNQGVFKRQIFKEGAAPGNAIGEDSLNLLAKTLSVTVPEVEDMLDEGMPVQKDAAKRWLAGRKAIGVIDSEDPAEPQDETLSLEAPPPAGDDAAGFGED